MAMGFQLLFFALWLLRMQTEIFKQKLRVRRLGLVDTTNRIAG
jgi:ABC-type transport system involved in cytochrome c biogenesis permease subunit